MKKTKIITKTFFILTLALILAAPGEIKAVEYYTWSGAGGSNLWSTGSNWIGAPSLSATAAVLTFTGTNNLSTINDRVTTTNGITFASGAGSFVLSGSSLTIGNHTIANLSGTTQTIAVNINYGGSQPTILTTGGDIVFTGGIAGTNGFKKEGAGALVLSSTSTQTGWISVNGTFRVDAASGGALTGAPAFHYGGGFTSRAVSNDDGGGIFELIGKTSGPKTVVSSGSFIIQGSAGANQIIVNSNGNASGAELTFSAHSRATNGASNPTLNIDLSSTNSSLKLGGATTLLSYATVTQGGKTGFADLTAGAVAQQNLSGVGLLASTGNVATAKTSGITTIAGGVTSTATTLTITGTGAITGAGRFASSAIIMQEGVSGFAINTGTSGPSANGEFIIHQYSTVGDLTISSNIASISSASRKLIKTGAGRLVLSGTSPNLGGATDIQQGEMRNNGSLGKTSVVFIRRDGTLSGGGVFGGTDGVYTPVHVFTGGTLDGTHNGANALTIHGSLTFYEASTFEVGLFDTMGAALNVVDDPSVSGATVSLNGNLVLTLNYAPLADSSITLLTTNGELGNTKFSMVNGAAFSGVDNDRFSLSYGGNLYDFQIFYNTTSVTLMAVVPEPGSILLALCGGGLLLLRRCRIAWLSRSSGNGKY